MTIEAQQLKLCVVIRTIGNMV